MLHSSQLTHSARKPVATSIVASCLTLSAYAAPPGKRAEYAEKIYNEYTASSNDKISFDLSVLGRGRLQDLVDQSMGQPMGHALTSHLNPITLPGKWFAPEMDAITLSNTLEDGAKTLSDPITEGNYRILDVITTHGHHRSSHKAIEFCWKSQLHCVLLNPGIELANTAQASTLC